MSIDRPRNIRLALSLEEHRMVHALADAEGTTVAEVLRRFIRKAHAKKLGGRDGFDPSVGGSSKRK